MRVPQPVPPDLAAAARWLDSWRRRRTTRGLPAQVWDRAATLAGRHGVSATARALRLDYYRIKARLRVGGADEPPGAAPGFVEVAPRSPVPQPQCPPPECVVEFDDGRGARMRVRLPGAAPAALASLARLFLGRPA